MHRESTKHEGTMHAIVGLPMETVQELVGAVQKDGVVSIANHNTALQVVITGSPDPVERVSAIAIDQGARAIPLIVSGAWHSELMRGAEEEFQECLEKASFQSSQSTVVFNVTGDVETAPEKIKSIMAKQLYSPVKWYDAMQKMISEEVEIFTEVGPGKVLTSILKKILPKGYPAGVHNVYDLKTLERFLKAVT